MRDPYYAQLDFLLTPFDQLHAAHERQWPNNQPLAVHRWHDADLTCAHGKDNLTGWGRTTIPVGCVGAGLANARRLVVGAQEGCFRGAPIYDGRHLAALDRDFDGDEVMAPVPHQPHSEMGQPAHAEARRLAKEIADTLLRSGAFRFLPNARGGACQAALFTLDYQWLLCRAPAPCPTVAKRMMGLPRAWAPRRAETKKALPACSIRRLNSITPKRPNGAVLDVMLHPTAVRGEEGLAALVTLIMTFFARGGYALQFNVVGCGHFTRRPAPPERYATLQVRVTGWSVYFTTLPQFEQDAFIARQVHGL
jgi:hypothetical protein